MAANAGPNTSERSDENGSTSVEETASADTGTDTVVEGVASTSTIERDGRCPVCDVAYDSVSVHGTGLLVNLLDNDRYRRVCFEPVEQEGPRIRFYHHTHEQTALSE